MNDYFLNETTNGLELVIKDAPNWHPLRLDFSQGKIHHRFKRLNQDQELIKKAIGFKKGEPLLVFDTTAGLGTEAFLLAALGCNVILFERNLTICTLLKDALSRGACDPNLAAIMANMRLIESCAIATLQHHKELPVPDVIYCDPMFETRKKSTLAKKEMQILQNVVGADEDASELVHVACSKAKKRVVVKRALYAPPLKEKPDFQYQGKSHRYDIYLIKP